LRRSRRRRTLGLTVTAREVRIHAPVWTPRAEIERYVALQQDWLRRTWARLQTQAVPVHPENSVRYLGRTLEIVRHPSLLVSVARRGNVLHVHAPAHEPLDALLRDWLVARAERVLAWRTRRLAGRFGRAPTRFALSNAQTQWGSCTRRGHVRLNWRLVQAPLALVDYVAAHELAHLLHLDHSPRFWAEVARICPDALARRAELRKMGHTLFCI
jgi:hypothetical protein